MKWLCDYNIGVITIENSLFIGKFVKLPNKGIKLPLGGVWGTNIKWLLGFDGMCWIGVYICTFFNECPHLASVRECVHV
jgi:hypothetical protein